MPDQRRDDQATLGGPSRRSLLRMVGAWGFAFFGLSVGLWSAAIARFFVPNATSEPSGRFKVGRPSDYRRDYIETRYQQRYGVWIVHGLYRGKPEIYALGSRCTHLGCITVWQDAEQKFKCPCHGSGFRLDGLNVEGPAPRPLERYAIRLTEDGQLEIDRQRIFRQELGQWDDPASFVVV